jgi:hypothetical protein
VAIDNAPAYKASPSVKNRVWFSAALAPGMKILLRNNSVNRNMFFDTCRRVVKDNGVFPPSKRRRVVVFIDYV